MSRRKKLHLFQKIFGEDFNKLLKMEIQGGEEQCLTMFAETLTLII